MEIEKHEWNKDAYHCGMKDRQSGFVGLDQNPWESERDRAEWEAGWKQMDAQLKAGMEATQPLDFGD